MTGVALTQVLLWQMLLTALLRASDLPKVESYHNQYPIVLVHGVLGWGRDEMGSFNYWGAFRGDLEIQLRARGYRVLTVGLGPISSSWDRACELYAILKGGVVDYGEAHAVEHGHDRFGQKYDRGLFPEWGTINPKTGDVYKVHLLTHSLGGLTARVLSQLLMDGHFDFSNEDSEEDKSKWISSITTVSTPHDGATLADQIRGIEGPAIKLFTSISLLLGTLGRRGSQIFDFKLDHFDAGYRRGKEGLRAYVSRIFQSPLFKPNFKDSALYDLSTTGMQHLNAWIKPNANIFYMSYSTIDSRPSGFRLAHVPNIRSMIPLLQPFSAYIGHLRHKDITWQPNDGAVNTVSTKSPASEASRTFDGQIHAGVWNFIAQIEMDHLTVVGWNPFRNSEQIYFTHVRVLVKLESHGVHRQLSTNTSSMTMIELPAQDTLVLRETVERANIHHASKYWNWNGDQLGQACRNATSVDMTEYCKWILLSEEPK